MFWKLRRGEKETDRQIVAQNSRQELEMGREGCLKANTCCGRQLESCEVLMLENMLVKKGTRINMEWAHRMLPVLHVFLALDLSMVAHHETDL
jgi:hypothetical protein